MIFFGSKLPAIVEFFWIIWLSQKSDRFGSVRLGQNWVRSNTTSHLTSMKLPKSFRTFVFWKRQKKFVLIFQIIPHRKDFHMSYIMLMTYFYVICLCRINFFLQLLVNCIKQLFFTIIDNFFNEYHHTLMICHMSFTCDIYGSLCTMNSKALWQWPF